MTVSREWMGQLRAVVEEIKQAHDPPRTPEIEAWRAFHYHQALNFVPPMEQTPRARQERAVNRIASRFAWGPDAVAHFLDTRGATYLTDLSDPQLDDLHERMLAYEDAAMNGWSSPDEPAAY